MELDLQSLFELHVHSCSRWLRDRNPPPSSPQLGSYTRALVVSQDRWHLFVPSWVVGTTSLEWSAWVERVKWGRRAPPPSASWAENTVNIERTRERGYLHSPVLTVCVYKLYLMLEGDRQSTVLARRWVQVWSYLFFKRDGWDVCTLHCLTYTATLPSQDPPLSCLDF